MIEVSFRFPENTERKFRRAIELHRLVNDENDKTVLKIIDELATYYTKSKKYQVCPRMDGSIGQWRIPSFRMH